MTSTPVSPSNITPITNNILMDINSDTEAEQVALELAQAQEQVCTANKAWERCQEEQKRKEEEEEMRWIAVMEAAPREAEEILEREWQIQLQVSTGVLQNLTFINLSHRKIWRHQ